MQNKKLLDAAVRAGDAAKDALNHPGVRAQLDLLVDECHSKLLAIDAATDPDGAKSKGALVEYQLAHKLRGRLASAVVNGDQAQEILNKQLLK